VLAIVAGLFIWRPWIQKTIPVIGSGRPYLAIVYFRNISGDSGIDNWKTIFPELLMDDLGQSRHVHVIEPIKIYSTLQDLDLLESENYSESDLRKICEEVQASHVLTGRILKPENNYNVDVTLYRADTLEQMGSEEVEGGPEIEIHTLVDRLTLEIKNLLGLTETQIADDIDLGIGDIRPKSEEAYEFYARAIRAADIDRDYKQSNDLLKKALELEPDFGSAMISLSIFHSNTGMVREAKDWIEKALEYQGKISVKELNFAQATLNEFSEKTIDEAFRYYKEILRDYPDNVFANANSGFRHFFLEAYDETIKYNGNFFGRKITPIPYKFLAQAYCAMGLYEKAVECLNFFLENIEESEFVRSRLALAYLSQGDYNSALLEIEKSPKLDPNLDHLYATGRLIYCRDDFQGAEKAFEELKKSQHLWLQYTAFLSLHNTMLAQGRYEEARVHLRDGIAFAEKYGLDDFGAELYLVLLYNYIKAGQPEEAINAFDVSWEIAHNAGFFTEALKRRLMHLSGMAMLEIGDLEEAQTISTSLKDFIDSGKNKKAIRLFYHLSGLIEERNGNLEKALELFSDALELAPYEHDSEVYLRLDRAPYLESLGRTYFKMGELEKAIEHFEKIQSLTLGRLDYGDICAKSYYTLGKICEQKGWEGKAIENYEKFLSLWKDADPGLPEVEDAKERLAGLRGE